MANISNSTSNTLVSGTSGNDHVYNWDGDSVYNWHGDSVSIDTDKDDDIVLNYGSNVTINTGDGDDTVDNYDGSNVTINTGAGNDTVDNREISNASINTGDGDDLISLYSSASLNVIQYAAGDGNDTVIGFKAGDTLSISGSSYSTQVSGNDVLVKVGNDTITLKNVYATADSIHINGETIALERKVITLTEGDDRLYAFRDSISIVESADNDSVDNYGSNNWHGDSVSIDTDKDDDIVLNYGSNVTINTGDGADTVDNYDGSNVTINTGAGNDTVDNRTNESVTIDTGAGNDSIYNSGNFDVSINTGAGNDTVDNSNGKRVTINTGAGDDRISLGAYYASLNVIQYAEGDGNDAIYGFNATSTLSISGASYSTTTSGNDVIVTVGNGKITLEGAASLDAVNIVFEEKATVNPLLIVGTEGADNITNTLNGATIQALKRFNRRRRRQRYHSKLRRQRHDKRRGG